MKDRPYWNMEVEPLLGTKEIKELQWRNLKSHLEMLYARSRLWREYMDEKSAQPDKIKSLDDFSKAFPVLEKDDMRALAMKYLPEGPRGMLDAMLSVSSREIVLVSATSGTTGEPTPYLFSKEDLKINFESFARAIWRTGIRPGDIIVHAMALSMFGAGIPLVYAVIEYGATLLPVGAEGGTERLLNYIKVLGPMEGIDGMFITPSFAEYLIEKCKELTGMDVKDLRIKRLMCGGEPGAGIQEVRERLMKSYNTLVFDMMGLGPIAFTSCPTEEYRGMHFLTEDISLLEIVDIETKEPIPMEDGARGVLVFTPLKGYCLNVLRHTPGDVVEIYTDKCPCGGSGIRMRVIGRTDDMLKVKGVMVYPAAIEGVLNSFIPRITGEFRIILTSPPPRVEPPLKLKVEYGTDTKPEELDKLTKEIGERMHDKIRVRPEIEWVPAGSFERTVHKKKYFEKRY